MNRYQLGALAVLLAAPTAARTAIGQTAPAQAPAPAAAPVGIGACDTFLTAYARCVASPGVPDSARAAIAGGISNMRTSFRDAAARSPEARESIRQQCVSSHDMVRTRMIEAFKCDFPAATEMPALPDTAVAAAPAAAPKPAPQPADPAADTARKANAYTAVQNDIVESRPMRKELADHVTNNERVLRLGTKLGANAWYLFGISDFDRIIKNLQEAIDLPGTVPEVDPKAAELLKALVAVNPVIKELSRYQTTREFREDGFKLAQQRQPVLVAGMRGAIAAADAYSTALFDRRMLIDERRVTALPQGSLAQGLLATSLETRRLMRRYEALEKPADVPAFLAAIAAVVTANKTLSLTVGGLSPKPDSACADYSEGLDKLVGHGRDLAHDVRTGADPSQPSDLFTKAFNSSSDSYTGCLRKEARARP